MLVKEFALGGGVSITGVQFEKNDNATELPEVALWDRIRASDATLACRYVVS